MKVVATRRASTRTWDDLVREGYIIAGGPDTVAERLRAACGELKVGNFLAILHIGNMPDELTKQNITLFGEQVIPKVRDLWDDGGYEHHWWPTGTGAR
jgi:hypothetical protein